MHLLLLHYGFYMRKSEKLAAASLSISHPAGRLQVHVVAYIFNGKIGIFDRTGLRYMLRLIFWLGKQVTATDQA